MATWFVPTTTKLSIFLLYCAMVCTHNYQVIYFPPLFFWVDVYFNGWLVMDEEDQV